MVEHLTRLTTGVSGLDAILGGGFVEGASYIIQGSPGAGKTILSNQIAFSQAASGHPVLYVTLLAETHDRLFQSLSTLSYFDNTALGDKIKYVSVFQCLRDEGLDSVVKLIREETQRQSARLLVFDGLLNARDRAETELDVKTFVATIQSQAAFVGCTVLFLTSTRLQESNPEHTMVDGVLDLSDELIGERTFRRLQVRKSRGSAALSGFHQFLIDDNGVTVFPRLEAFLPVPSINAPPSSARIQTGVNGLDQLIGGGLPEGSVTILMGPPGSGKTSLSLSFFSLASASQPALYFGFFETPERLIMKASSFGLAIDPLISSGAAEIIWNPLTENIMDKLAHQLLAAVKRSGVKRLIIDGLNGFERAAVTPGRLVEFFASLTNELRALNVTTIMTWEMREIYGKAGTSPLPDISALLDNLLVVRSEKAASTTRRLFSVLKLRNSTFKPSDFELEFSASGLSISCADESGVTEPEKG
ncbi:MAG: serine/threonine protein kinase [Rhodospirillales bacterium]|nr:serine/threonine protein kinase [Rhodospirillales bacterium]MDE2319786.1 serine/threonine protein kinase [Rhodospirillales bacterium]